MIASEREMRADRDQRLLKAELERLHARVTAGAGPAPDRDDDEPGDTRLARFQAVFRLSTFERELLIWCAGSELDSRFSPPTFGHALSALDGGHWDALAPDAPLRHWRLIELAPGPGLIDRPLRIDERILHHLIGVTSVDPRLDGVLRIGADAAGTVTPAQAGVAAHVAGVLARTGRGPIVLLDGADGETRERVAAHVASALGRIPAVISADRLPLSGTGSVALARLAEREVALVGALPFVAVCEASQGAESFVGELGCPVLVGVTPSAPQAFRGAIRCTVPSPGVADQRELWRRLLGEEEEAARAAVSFRFEVGDIETVARDVAGHGLHHACRLHARSALGGLAERVEPCASWDDLVLPAPAVETLRDIARRIRNRARVHEDWGMAGSSPRGLGVTALFTGESGTGKTLAAEALAVDLDLDLYRIDLAAVVSKYIGETEKNLKRIFDIADAGGAVLLFDEADALFGRRGEVRDSHDRYANLEISYLLQRMDAYRGLAILTTNLKAALDRAFLRRLQFVLNFPFPDAATRERIWRLMFPPKVPCADLDWARLSRLQLPGGHIRTIALGAAFLAASEDTPVTMAHVLAAARREYAKLERPLTDAETGGWV
ncbi:ATP-binding protein [Spongiactinospora sp. TRM90649]|uniref:ATP-binding protein n=1 Tax=Spongiactinospora sp. TRM90649 TaxID=3031114 RepID=UPI0023F8551A|nr:ATP-binding protein [Spongiactinospora sp. TRM90649]MDF5753120.1 ATP-binding protein [Spongiactinospora sp. TRM90649]